MTIKEFMDKCREMDDKFTNPDGILYSEGMAETCEIWSNDACKGYFIHAATSAGLDNKTIKNVLSEMRWSYDFMALEQAEDFYRKFCTKHKVT